MQQAFQIISSGFPVKSISIHLKKCWWGLGFILEAIQTNWPTLAHTQACTCQSNDFKPSLTDSSANFSYTTHALLNLHANLIPKPSGDEALVKWEFSEFPQINMGQILLYARARLLMGAERVVFSYPCSMLYPYGLHLYSFCENMSQIPRSSPSCTD